MRCVRLAIVVEAFCTMTAGSLYLLSSVSEHFVGFEVVADAAVAVIRV